MDKRVKFYGLGDLGASRHFPRIEEVLSFFAKNPEKPNDVNDIIEFANIVKYIESKTFSQNWDENYVKFLQDLKPKLESMIARFFRESSKDEVIKAICEIETTYISDFLEQFKKYKLAGKISESDFEKAISKSKIHISSLLEVKYFANAYPNLTKKLFLSDPHNFELLLGNFTHRNSHEIYLPKISKDEMRELCVSYVDSDFAHPGYIDLLLQPIAIGKYLDVNPKLRRKIKMRNKEIENEIFAKGTGVRSEFGLHVFALREDYEEALVKKNSREVIALVEKD